MTYTTIISALQLQALMQSPAPLCIFDCSFDLADTAAGSAAYAQSHIPGAIYAHLDQHLSAQPDADRASGGRHPLPTREAFAAWLQSIGFNNDMQAVVYDRNGHNYCGRLWWMLKWAGHAGVAVLDGGLQAWQAAGGALESGAANTTPAAGNFALKPSLVPLKTLDAVAADLNKQQTIVDARGAPRYRGDVEPLDPIAGHIPGARNRPFTENFNADGTFKSAAQLRSEFDALLAGSDAGDVIHQCGSGVSAVPNLLAMEVAGLHGSALFAGSWSEWSRTAGLPVARGEH